MNAMRIARLTGAMVVIIALSGCFDVETTVSVASNRDLNTHIVLRMDRAVYDMMPPEERASFCPPSSIVIDQRNALCEVSRTTELAAGEKAALGDNAATAVRVEHLEASSSVRVTFPLEAMLNEVRDGFTPPSGDEFLSEEAVSDMQRAALSGRSLIFKVRGDQITQSNGRLNDNRTEAEWVFPLVDVIEGSYRKEDGFAEVAVQPID